MKTLNIYFCILFVSFAFTNVLSAYASSQSENNYPEMTSKVEKPKIDIQSAIISNNLEAVKQYIKEGGDVNIKDPVSGSTPLITATTFGKTDIAKALIDANAELDIKNNEGSTALHAAAFFCRVEIVQMLVDAGAEKTIRNNHGATPRESVIVPFNEMKPVYEMIQQQLAPLGLKINLKELEITRPMVARMLQ
ncbi:ankyrin repeat domain-containing protein [Maribellus comscasis]|uniref:Ankyrin repeat domain-containing protein n=1 Tax=Maribellus comscasis TaxID=2681766 RepID=A0A6I6JTB6_9BACT|nr:ankyrin repeat domain-containing protein [Maribellus comscasis]QGY45711.1 ankyrin repeat domain-containing protein [Maribellus comscasis]